MAGAHVLDNADAILVIDMQNSFLRPGGAMYEHRNASIVEPDKTIEGIAELVALATARELPVIYTRHCYRPGYADVGGATRRLFASMDAKPLVTGSWDAAIVDELLPGPDALVVDKTRMDAFYNTDLEVLLRGVGASRLIVSGIVTNACVETTTRSAAMRDLDVTILEDCCSTYSAEHQESALKALEFYLFAQIDSLSDIARR